jgi:hypothetical protein
MLWAVEVSKVVAQFGQGPRSNMKVRPILASSTTAASTLFALTTVRGW